eukprot:4537528-Prymnesium_polylepis.2
MTPVERGLVLAALCKSLLRCKLVPKCCAGPTCEHLIETLGGRVVDVEAVGRVDHEDNSRALT